MNARPLRALLAAASLLTLPTPARAQDEAQPAPSAAPAPPPAPAPAAPATAPPAPETPPPLVKEAPVHFEVGARLEYGVPEGDYFAGAPIGTPLNDPSKYTPGITARAPIALDLGVRIVKYLFVGAFADYAFVGTSCPAIEGGSGDAPSCSAHGARVGLRFQVHLFPRRVLDPWFGVSLAHEWLTYALDASGGHTSWTLDGWDLVDLSAGLDVRAFQGLGVGPYFGVTSGTFASASGSGTGSAPPGAAAMASGPLPSSSHQWITVGLRGTFELSVAQEAPSSSPP